MDTEIRCNDSFVAKEVLYRESVFAKGEIFKQKMFVAKNVPVPEKFQDSCLYVIK